LVPPSSDPASVLRDLSTALRNHGCRWYLFGAQAVTIWGRPRLTTDVDVTVRLDSGTIEDLMATLMAAGFRLPAEVTDESVRATRVLPLVHESSGMPLDIVLAGPGLEEEFLARAIAVEIDGVAVPVISPEDLLITKVLAGRPKDVEDIRGVLYLRATSLDLGYIRRTLTAIEDALGHSDLRPLFEAELLRVQESG
jgi:predicted nucleotidyltransferase